MAARTGDAGAAMAYLVGVGGAFILGIIGTSIVTLFTDLGPEAYQKSLNYSLYISVMRLLHGF